MHKHKIRLRGVTEF